MHKNRSFFNQNEYRKEVLPEEFKKIARQSFKFVKVESKITSTRIGYVKIEGSYEDTRSRLKNGEITGLVEVPAPWKARDWTKHWDANKKQTGRSKNREAKADWRQEINEKVKA